MAKKPAKAFKAPMPMKKGAMPMMDMGTMPMTKKSAQDTKDLAAMMRKGKVKKSTKKAAVKVARAEKVVADGH